MSQAKRNGFIAAAMGGDNKCSGGKRGSAASYRAGHAAFRPETVNVHVPPNEDAISIRARQAGIFTPRTPDGKRRLRLHLSNIDMEKIKRGRPWDATVTDVTTKKRYHAQGADCGSPGCFCDAIAREVTE